MQGFRVTVSNGNSIYVPICGGYDQDEFVVHDGNLRVQVCQPSMRYKFNVRAIL